MAFKAAIYNPPCLNGHHHERPLQIFSSVVSIQPCCAVVTGSQCCFWTLPFLCLILNSFLNSYLDFTWIITWIYAFVLFF